MNKKKFKFLFLVPIAVAMWVGSLLGFEVDTHTLLSQKAISASQLNSYLTTVLGFEFPLGTGEEVGQGLFKRVDDLVANVGAVNEDKPDIRSRHHFHDPTKAWADAGLTGLGTSSVLWSQDPNQMIGGKHSWQDARNSYFNALTATDPADRKKYYAETFEALGHLIHLVQDAATPAHTRNDAHLGLTTGNKLFPFLNVDRFHQWAKEKGGGAINSAGSVPFAPSILNQSYSNLVPIAGIIDTTTAAGPATPSEGTNIGIAEFSNANFFSDDTILKEYAYPNTTQLDLTEEAGPDGPETRFYLRKSFGPGPIGYRAAVSTLLASKLPFGFPTQQWELDNNVMSDYGALLFPRAIGYSAGLIDYFYRGSIEFHNPDPPDPPFSTPPTTITLSLANATPAEETGDGILRLVLQYIGQYNTSEGFPSIVVSEETAQNVTRSLQNTTVPFSSLPFPATVGPTCFPILLFICESAVFYNVLLVYRGPLGWEDNSVIVSRCGLTLTHELWTFGERMVTSINCGEPM
jgi:hypothetical protein